MPEMADVEVLKKRMNEKVKGETIFGVKILKSALVKEADLEEKLAGQKILESSRYGKYLFVKLAHGYLILHFGLTGHLIFEKDKNRKINPRAMLVVSTETFDLIYEARAAHLFGMAGWCENPEKFIAEKKMGPDAGAVGEEDFLGIMRSARGAVKAALMDQHKIAGIGNVYADEILLQAGVHPQVPAKSLTGERLRRIYEEIHRIHKSAVAVEAVRSKMPDWALMKTRHASELCPKCGAKLRNVEVNSRETLFCPHCQHL